MPNVPQQELDAAASGKVDEVFGKDAEGRTVLRAAKADRIIDWLAFENESAFQSHPFKMNSKTDSVLQIPANWKHSSSHSREF